MNKKEKLFTSLRYNFTAEEKKEKQDRITLLLFDKKQIQDEKKNLMAQYSARIKDIDSQLDSEAEKVRSGFEFRSTECEVTYNYETGQVTTIRLDNFGVVHIRPMTSEEKRYQMTISNHDSKDLEKQVKEVAEEFGKTVEAEGLAEVDQDKKNEYR